MTTHPAEDLATGAPLTVYTIGHSTHPIERFVELLRGHGISALGDVRSQPWSRRNPQFNRETLQRSLRDAGIAYVYLGAELGARSDDPACYEGERVSYELLARSAAFRRGLERVAEGARRYRLAIMCAEQEPLHCHRTILVARQLVARGMAVRHILADGALEDHGATVRRLMRGLGIAPDDLFGATPEQEAAAYAAQGARMAYRRGRRRDVLG